MFLPEPIEEEKLNILFLKYQNGDIESRNIIIESNLRLVMSLVKIHYKSFYESLYYIEYDDLFEVGCIGLIKAVDNYNVSYKVKFATYASRCILNEILMFLRKNKRRKGEVSFEDNLSYDAEGNELHLEDILGTEADIVTKNIENKTERKILYEEINKLKGRDKEIMILRYGLGGCKEMTQKDVAKKLGISQSYISRIEKKVIKKLQTLTKI